MSNNFPHSGKWFYCCLCQQYWAASNGQGGQGGFSKQCPSCNLVKKARYYSCDQCNVTMVDSLGAINRKESHITPWGAPHPHCPGCNQLPKSVTQSHACSELNGLLTTARAQCPFCEENERAEGLVNGVINTEGAGNKTDIAPIEGANEFFDPSSLVLEELERKASEMRSLEAEAEAREAKARERLRQVEARLQQEMSRRSEAERKSKEIEEGLRRQPENDTGRIEAAIKASEAAARFEGERKARIAAEQAKAEAEAKLREMEAKAYEAEAKIHGIEAEARRIEENYKVEIDWIRAELEEAAMTARQAEENHRDEMARITAELEAQAHQSVVNARQQYQIKLEEAAAIAQDASFNLEETRKKLSEAEAKCLEIEDRARQAENSSRRLEETRKKLSEVEAKCLEIEDRARQAENSSRRLYMILKQGFSAAEQIIAETPNVGDEDKNAGNEGNKAEVVIPLDPAITGRLDDSFSETPRSVVNGSAHYEDFPSPDRMRALFEAAARVNAPDDEGA